MATHSPHAVTLWPSDEVMWGVWRRLVEEPDSAAAFAGLVLDPLVDGLARQYPRSDPHDLTNAAEDAVLAFLKRPTAYDPSRLPLNSFLTVIAIRKLRSLWAAGRKHVVGRIPWDTVELALPARNEEVDDDSLSFDTPELRVVVEAFTADERTVFDLMLGGERATPVYAEVLGLAERPVPEQETGVKRVKDRIKARLKRAAEEQP